MEIPYAVKPRPDTGLYNAKLGIWLFLASEVMLFGALFSSYILLRVNAAPGTWPHHWLNIWLVCAVAFLCIKSYEYHDKFIHYEVILKDGRIADGHMQKDSTTNLVVLEGRWVTSHAQLMDPPLHQE